MKKTTMVGCTMLVFLVLFTACSSSSATSNLTPKQVEMADFYADMSCELAQATADNDFEAALDIIATYDQRATDKGYPSLSLMREVKTTNHDEFEALILSKAKQKCPSLIEELEAAAEE